MKDKNYKLQTNHKLQITNKVAHELHELPRIGTTSNEKFLQGGPGEKERSLEDKKVRRLKASIPDVQATFYQLHNILHFAAFAAGSVLLKKPSRGPKGLIGPPLSMPWGPWPPEAVKDAI